MTNFMVKSGEAVKDVFPKRIAHTKGEAAVVVTVAGNVNKTFNTFITRTAQGQQRERVGEWASGVGGVAGKVACVCVFA